MANSHGAVPPPEITLVDRGHGNPAPGTVALANHATGSPVVYQDADSARPTSTTVVSDAAGLNRSASVASQGGGLARNGTLKKKGSVRRTGSLRRSASKRSLAAGSIKGLGDQDGDGEYNSIFNTPIPTSGSPTEVLANRFQAWRQLLKSLITYFREIQTSYDTRAKALHKVQNTLSNISHPAVFTSDRGLADATRILDEYHKRSINEANKSRDIENDVVGALTGLRSDLSQKIKEIKSLSGDFKNSVDKERDATRKELEKLNEALQHAEQDDGAATGKNDPFVIKLGVDRAIEKQIDEENYLHRAYLNLESSGRELESIVVGEIQKAYNALAGILKREGDDAYTAVESLRTGPISMPKDQDWYEFVTSDPHFVDPGFALRRIEDIQYPGKHHPAAGEIRSGMLERKSKYLKSYTPGWYVLSPTHLHEFKSADKIFSQPPVMSLYLPDQKLGSHSELGSGSHKFMLKGKQSGMGHKGHNWVFRAESYETMLAWFEAIRTLTEASGAERDAFVREQTRASTALSDRQTVSSDGIEEDEADQVPYSADVASLAGNDFNEPKQPRPQPGGRFPSDLQLHQAGTIATSDSDEDAAVVVAAAAALPSGPTTHDYGAEDPYRLQGVQTVAGESSTAREAAALPSSTQIPGPVSDPDAPVPSAAPAIAPVAAPELKSEDIVPPPGPPTSAQTNGGLGGLEKAGARETGRLFPTPIRHDTSMSASALHVPGEFPKRTATQK